MSAPRFVMVFGMHRSGTSCLAGCLERCGVYLGEVARSNKYNAKGNLELDDARLLDDRILERHGGSWADPPGELVVDADDRDAMAAIVAALREREPCGLKDPRALLLADAWLDAVGDATLVGTWRHPAAVARSLAQRNDMPAEQAHALWRRHNAELLRLHDARPFPIVEFDLSRPERYCSTVVDVARRIGLEPDVARLVEFVSRDLDHSAVEELVVPESCRAMVDELRARTTTVDEDLVGGARPSAPRRSGSRLTIVAGAPGAGKSTWIRRHAADCDAVLLPDKGAAATLAAGGHFALHYDLLRPWRKMHGRAGADVGDRLRRLLRRARAGLRGPFALDRRLAELFDAGADVDAVVVVTPPDVLRARLAARPDTDVDERLPVDATRACRDLVAFLRARGVEPRVVDGTDEAFAPLTEGAAGG